MALTQPQRGKILAAIIAVVVVGGLVWSQVTERAVDGRVDDLLVDLSEAYEGTDAGDIPPLFPHERTDLFDRAGHEPTAIAQVDGNWRANYRVAWLSEARCIFVTWTPSGADIADPRRCP